MFGSQILDVGIGLIMLFLLLSLVCSSMKEGLETFLKYRSKDLEAGLCEIFNDPDRKNLVPQFYRNPLVFALFRGHYTPGKRSNLPSYIPSQIFALAVLDMVKTEPADSYLSQTLKPLIESAGNNLARAQKNIEDWYNGSMDRVSGWYKRRTQIIIAALGFGIALAFNVDAFSVARYLNANPAVRSAWAEQAKRSASSVPSATELGQWLNVTDIPLGWNIPRADNVSAGNTSAGYTAAWQTIPHDPYGWLLKVAGILLTGFCVSLGAPFWFDVLNKFMVVRSTVKPEEKSRDEPSKA